MAPTFVAQFQGGLKIKRSVFNADPVWAVLTISALVVYKSSTAHRCAPKSFIDYIELRDIQAVVPKKKTFTVYGPATLVFQCKDADECAQWIQEISKAWSCAKMQTTQQQMQTTQQQLQTTQQQLQTTQQQDTITHALSQTSSTPRVSCTAAQCQVGFLNIEHDAPTPSASSCASGPVSLVPGTRVRLGSMSRFAIVVDGAHHAGPDYLLVQLEGMESQLAVRASLLSPAHEDELAVPLESEAPRPMHLAHELKAPKDECDEKTIKLLDVLRTEKYYADMPVGDAGPECSICMMDYEVDVNLLRLPCFHVFHDECIRPWLLQQGTCSICSTDILEILKASQQEGRRHHRKGRGKGKGAKR